MPNTQPRLFSAAALYPVGSPGMEGVWESAGTVHVWVFPQRINYVMNPSFEKDLTGWVSTSYMNYEDGGVEDPTGVRTRCVHLTDDNAIMESNEFPVSLAEEGWWSLEAAVKGTGKVRLSLVGHAVYDDESESDEFFDGEWIDIDSDEYVVIKTLVSMSEDMFTATFRLEFEGEECWVDNCMADPNAAQWPYFDGSWFWGLEDDYSWYSEDDATDRTNETYSIWYNNRRNMRRRLFGYWETLDVPDSERSRWDYSLFDRRSAWSFDDDDDPLGTIKVREFRPGLGLDWVPQGTRIQDHWDDAVGISILGEHWVATWEYPETPSAITDRP